jgi:hypothetical protein
MTGRCLAFFAKASYRAVDMRVAVIGCEGPEHGMAGERKLEAGQVRGLLVRLERLEFRAGDEPERPRRQVRLVVMVCHDAGSLREALAIYCQRITTVASWNFKPTCAGTPARSVR